MITLKEILEQQPLTQLYCFKTDQKTKELVICTRPIVGETKISYLVSPWSNPCSEGLAIKVKKKTLIGKYNCKNVQFFKNASGMKDFLFIKAHAAVLIDNLYYLVKKDKKGASMLRVVAQWFKKDVRAMEKEIAEKFSKLRREE